MIRIYFLKKFNCNQKREGPTITDDACTVCRRPRRLMFYGSISYPLSSEALKFDLLAFSASDTKREGIHKFYGSYTTYYGPCQPTFCWSILRQTPIPPQTQTVFLVPSLICLYFEDRQTYQHITGHSTAHNVFSHICIKALCISFTRYIHTPTAQACPLKTTNLIVPGVFVPLLHPLSSCSLNLATYQTQRKSKT